MEEDIRQRVWETCLRANLETEFLDISDIRLSPGRAGSGASYVVITVRELASIMASQCEMQIVILDLNVE